jgi:glycosyltransferase involved in cell wall biosynthesis
LYGGTERVVSWLTEELVALGHDVTLFASGESRTAARLMPQCPQALRLSGTCKDPLAVHLAMTEEVYRMAAEFDVVHWHIDYLHYPVTVRERHPNLTTLHGRLDLPELQPVYRAYGHLPLVSISDAQRAPLPFANWIATVHHGMPAGSYRARLEPGQYLAFLGRFSPEKRPDRAIEIARRAGLPLKLAAKVEKSDEDYFNNVVKPLLSTPGIEYVGEIGEKDKNEFLSNAIALLFPIDWPEPFGLVMIESMACGTPVVAWSQGSVPEVLEDGVTGRLVPRIEEAVHAVQNIHSISRRRCREVFEQRFSSARMARDYLRVYERLAKGPQPMLDDRAVEVGQP